MDRVHSHHGASDAEKSGYELQGQSGQAILREQSSSQTLDAIDTNTAVAEQHAVSIHLHVFGLRVLLATVLTTVTLAALSLVMIDGFTFSTVNTTKLSETEKVDLLDTYNSYSGSVAAVVGMVFHQFVALLLPVFFLCFLAKKTTLSDRKTVLQHLGPMRLVAGALRWTERRQHAVRRCVCYLRQRPDDFSRQRFRLCHDQYHQLGVHCRHPQHRHDSTQRR